MNDEASDASGRAIPGSPRGMLPSVPTAPSTPRPARRRAGSGQARRCWYGSGRGRCRWRGCHRPRGRCGLAHDIRHRTLGRVVSVADPRLAAQSGGRDGDDDAASSGRSHHRAAARTVARSSRELTAKAPSNVDQSRSYNRPSADSTDGPPAIPALANTAWGTPRSATRCRRWPARSPRVRRYRIHGAR